MKDLELLSAKFLTADLPREKEYLRRYFDSAIQERMIVYYLVFGYDGKFTRFLQNYIDHTGLPCSKRWMHDMLVRIEAIEKRLAMAEKDGDFEMVAEIKSGKYWPKRTRWRKRHPGEPTTAELTQ